MTPKTQVKSLFFILHQHVQKKNSTGRNFASASICFVNRAISNKIPKFGKNKSQKVTVLLNNSVDPELFGIGIIIYLAKSHHWSAMHVTCISPAALIKFPNFTHFGSKTLFFSLITGYFLFFIVGEIRNFSKVKIFPWRYSSFQLFFHFLQ